MTIAELDHIFSTFIQRNNADRQPTNLACPLQSIMQNLAQYHRTVTPCAIAIFLQIWQPSEDEASLSGHHIASSCQCCIALRQAQTLYCTPIPNTNPTQARLGCFRGWHERFCSIQAQQCSLERAGSSDLRSARPGGASHLWNQQRPWCY
jgi:hypothetical protein